MTTPVFAKYGIAKWLLAFCFGLVLSALISWQLQQANRALSQQELQVVAGQLQQQILERLKLYQYGLAAVRGYVTILGEQGLTRASFRRYSQTRDISDEFPGARGFGLIRRVAATDMATFVQQARQDGMANFQIHRLKPNLNSEHNNNANPNPNPNANDGYIIQYIEPEAQNAQVLGLDIASEYHRRTAADAAMNTGQIQLTAPITLVQAAGKNQQAFLVLLPIYRTAAVPSTQAERQQQLWGWSCAPLVMSEILADLNVDRSSVHLELQDVSSQQPIRFYNAESNLTLAQGLEQHRLFEVLGRQWLLQLHASAEFTAQLHLLQPPLVFVICLSISWLISSLALVIASNRQRQQQIIAGQLRLASIVASSSDAIIGINFSGQISSWNQGAERIFGYSEPQVLGRNLTELLVPSELTSEELGYLAKVALGQPVEHFVSQRRRADGSLVEVSIAVAPIWDLANQLSGASITLRDVTVQRAVEAHIKELNQNLEIQVQQRTAELEVAQRSLKTVLDAVPSLIGYWDNQLVNRVANRAYHEWFDIELGQIPGMTMRQLKGETLFASHALQVDAVLRGEPQAFEWTMRLANGHERYCYTQYLPDLKQGQVRGFYSVVHDITEITESRQQLLRAVRENQALLQTINQQFQYSVADLKGHILEVNDNFCQALGYQHSELLGQNHRLFNSRVHPISFWHELWQTLLAGCSWHGEICNRTKTGELRWFDTVIAPFVGTDDKVERYVSLRTDISARKAAEFARNQSSQLLTNVLAAATELSIIATDPQGIIRMFNAGAELMLGYHAEELVGQASPMLLHRIDELISREYELSLEYSVAIEGFRVLSHKAECEQPETRQWTYVRKDGSALQVSLTTTAMRDQDEQLTGYLCIARDITAALLQQRELVSARDQLLIAAEVAQLGVWSWQVQDGAMQWNERMFEMYQQPLSLKSHGLSYRHWSQRVHPEDLAMAEACLMAAVAGTGVYEPVFRLLLPDGSNARIQAAAQVERDTTGKAIRVTGINRDITAQYELEAQLRLAKIQADTASDAKSAFLANMSHEIRTPMNAVLGMLKLLQVTELSLRQRDYVEKTLMAAKSLLGLLNDILDFSKIDAGKLQLEQYPFELEALMRDLGVMLSGSQAEQQVELWFDWDPQLPEVVVADRLRLQQVLLNLTANALKFTERGLVSLSLSVLELRSERVRVRIAVTDTGIGISPEQQQRIFDGFVQAEASTTRRFGGTGLGLAISKRLVELMGGQLQLSSQLGIGSQFWFDIELALPSHSGRVPPSPVLSGLRVLVAEDNPLVAASLIRLLQVQGYQAECATTGNEVLLKLRNSPTQPYDLILMDWQMPELDGFSVAQRIRQDQSMAKQPIIIMVTAHQRELLASYPPADWPFEQLLTKPVTPEQLRQALHQAVNPAHAVLPSLELKSNQLSLAGLRLLVVEDNALNRQVAAELLMAEGAQVSLAEDGYLGVQQVLTAEPAFDLVLMDMQMPNMDGLQATRCIRAEAGFAQVPIIAMTANVSASDIQMCLAAGMNDHVAKPVDMDELIPRVLFLTGRTSEPVAKIRLGPQSGDALLDDLSVILKRFSGDAELLQRMLVYCQTESARLLADIAQHYQTLNFSAAAASLHGLKGMTSTLGAKALAAAAGQLEQRFKTCAAIGLANAEIETELNQLRGLSEQSLQQLCCCLAAEAQTQAQALANSCEPVVLPAEAQQELREILALVASHNLFAIDKMAGFNAVLTPEQQTQVASIRKCINELDFIMAQDRLKTLLKDME